jgi:transcription elongation GreA/GreB family factor
MADKQALVAAVVTQLELELARQVAAANGAREEATDQDSRAEGKFDMRGQSAAYLAEGQARLAGEIAAAIAAWRALALRTFGPGDRVALGAHVTLESSGRRTSYFIGPASGGMEVTVGSDPVVVLTPASPLGRQLMGRIVGDRIAPSGRPSPLAFRVATVR